ncbi:MAG TPA: C25 family cysteine peptidase [Candidatus Acidoferrales bacterium]|nr:C25 family cysteine peptidase [Candidatus Acidoferrales bacterium]
MRRPPMVLLALVLLGSASTARALTLDRQFTYDVHRVRVSNREGYTSVQLQGGGRESRAGRPDLPWTAERIDLPPGMKVTAVEVTALATEPLAANALIAPAVVAAPGLGPVERSKPDPAFFSASTPQPAEIVSLGAQGDMRGHNVAYLRVNPVQWNPATGALTHLSRVSVRLTLDADDTPPLKRERIVREWEDGGLPSGIPSAELARTVTSVSAIPTGRAEPFVAQQVPSLLGSPVEYVIVTNDAMAPVFQQLADWKTQTGVPTVVRTLSFIQSQYPSAADDAERVRLFLRDAYTRWGTKWALLGGDTDVIPTRLAYCNFYVPGGEMIATDLYFSCLDGNWNADGDSLYGEAYYSSSNPGDNVDLLPDIYVGRAPCNTPADAQVFVNKTMQYEKTPLGNYEFRWLFMAEVLFPQPWTPGTIPTFDGAGVAEQLLPLTDEQPQIHVARLYANYTDSVYRAGALPENKTACVDSLDSGFGLALHVGHGYRNVMEVNGGDLTNADATALSNGNQLFNLYSINCTSNAINFPCIGEAFINNPNGGAVTNIGSTDFDFPSEGQQFQYEYFRQFFEGGVSAIGELEALQKLPFVSSANYDGVDRWTEFTLLELGDPELHMWMGSPLALTVTPPPSMAVSDTQITVHVVRAGSPLVGATVTGYKSGDDYESVTTNGNGDAVLPFHPDSLGSLTLTVTANNSRPWQASLPIVASSSAAVVIGHVPVDDDNLNGTHGDANGSVDAGELVDLGVVLKNQGGTSASGLSATLTTSDGLVSIVTPTVSYGTIGAGGSGAPVSPSTGFRVSFPYTLNDQREVPFVLLVSDGGGHSYRQTFQLTVHAPQLRSYAHVESETVGNGDGIPEPGETVNYVIKLRNLGTGAAHGVSLVLRSYDGLSTVSDSTSSLGDIAAGAEVSGDPVTFSPTSPGAVVSFVASDQYGVVDQQSIDFSGPPTPTSLLGTGAAGSIALTWAHLTTPDLLGYNVYRSTSSATGPFTKVNAWPTDRIAYFTDSGLQSLTRYYYRVTAVDSSGNESSQSATVSVSTNPPLHAIFPVPTGRNTPSSVALEYVYSPQQMDIAAGADVFYVLHADGTAPVDADGSSSTLGDFTTRGSYYAAGPSIAVLAPAQGFSFIAPAWDSAGVYVFDTQGNVRPGWPLMTDQPVWSSAAIGDLDGDGTMELAFASNGNNFYVMHANGTEWMDGDNNPSTKGVFKVLGQPYNYGTPALADLDGDGKPEIIYGGNDGNLYAWKSDGSNVPGFPFHTGGNITCSVAVGYLDGPGDTVPEIVFATTQDSLYVLEPNGQRRPGWPVWVRCAGNTKIPSPAIADMNNDGINDIVFQSPNGHLYCYYANAQGIPGLYGVAYSQLTASASECSPVVADIDGDGRNDVICGDENGQLSAISGATGQMLPGFPIQLQGEVRGTPSVGDIDRDGKTEIVVADWDKNIYVWDYDFPFQPSGTPPWPTFHHDARRTGFTGTPITVGAVGDPNGPNAAVETLEFASPAPNPTNSGSRMWFGIPQAMGGRTYALAIYDLAGRRVRLVDTGIARPGRFSLQWDLKDEARNPVHGGVFFARFTVGGKSLDRKLVVLP